MREHPVAVWTGFVAFAANLLAIGILKATGQEGAIVAQFAGAVVTSLLVGATAYGRERLKDAKSLENKP